MAAPNIGGVSVGLSPKSSLRKSIRDINRSRGHGNHNLWQGYSVKANRDWVFPSDRQFIHWLYFLEADPNVVSFDAAPPVVISSDAVESRGTELDAIAVYRDGHIEWHEVKSGNHFLDSDSSQFTAQRKAALDANAQYRLFNDHDLKPISAVAMRWHYALSFAASIREQAEVACHNAIVLHGKDHRQGTVKSLIEALSSFDPMVVIGLLVRLSVHGHFKLVMDERSFGYRSRWTYGC